MFGVVLCCDVLCWCDNTSVFCAFGVVLCRMLLCCLLSILYCDFKSDLQCCDEFQYFIDIITSTHILHVTQPLYGVVKVLSFAHLRIVGSYFLFTFKFSRNQTLDR